MPSDGKIPVTVCLIASWRELLALSLIALLPRGPDAASLSSPPPPLLPHAQVVTGWLGAGKTTLVNQILSGRSFRVSLSTAGAAACPHCMWWWWFFLGGGTGSPTAALPLSAASHAVLPRQPRQEDRGH